MVAAFMMFAFIRIYLAIDRKVNTPCFDAL